MKQRTYILNCVGFPYLPSSGQAVYSSLREGEEVGFQREPKNSHDRNAIRVYDLLSDLPVGYVEKAAAKELAPLIDKGVKFIATVKKAPVLEHGEVRHPMMLIFT